MPWAFSCVRPPVGNPVEKATSDGTFQTGRGIEGITAAIIAMATGEEDPRQLLRSLERAVIGNIGRRENQVLGIQRLSLLLETLIEGADDWFFVLCNSRTDESEERRKQHNGFHGTLTGERKT
jgi:hypothetical protein